MIKDRNDQEIRADVFMTRREWLLLRKLAATEDLTALEYISNIVTSFVKNQLRGEYLKLFNGMDVYEFANLFGDVKDDGTIDFDTSAVKREKDKVKDKYK